MYNRASLVAQLGKNLPVMRETWVQSLGCKDPLEKGKATYSSILAWRILDCTVRGVAESDMTERLSLTHNMYNKNGPLENVPVKNYQFPRLQSNHQIEGISQYHPITAIP